MKRCIRAIIHARYHEKEPRTRAEIANSRARRTVDAARVPKASLDILKVEGRPCERERCDEWDWMMKKDFHGRKKKE